MSVIYMRALLGPHSNNFYSKIMSRPVENIRQAFNSSAYCTVVAQDKFIPRLQESAAKIQPENFFIRILGYGKNMDWAKGMSQISEEAARQLAGGNNAEDVLRFIASNARTLEKNPLKKEVFGVLRAKRKNWEYKKELSEQYRYLDCTFVPYNSYTSSFDRFFTKTLKSAKNVSKGGYDTVVWVENPFEKTGITTVGKSNYALKNGLGGLREGSTFVVFPSGKNVNKSLDTALSYYKELNKKFRNKKLDNNDLKQINENIAVIQWVLSHAMPWGRGSDAITNSFIKSIYRSFNIKTHPLKEGVSLDMEAFCTELKDYIKKYPKYYEKPPELVR